MALPAPSPLVSRTDTIIPQGLWRGGLTGHCPTALRFLPGTERQWSVVVKSRALESDHWDSNLGNLEKMTFPF